MSESFQVLKIHILENIDLQYYKRFHQNIFHYGKQLRKSLLYSSGWPVTCSTDQGALNLKDPLPLAHKDNYYRGAQLCVYLLYVMQSPIQHEHSKTQTKAVNLKGEVSFYFKRPVNFQFLSFCLSSFIFFCLSFKENFLEGMRFYSQD